MSDNNGNGFVTRQQLQNGSVRAYLPVECKSGRKYCLQTLTEGELSGYEALALEILKSPRSERIAAIETFMQRGRRELLCLGMVERPEGERLYADGEADKIADEIPAPDAAELLAAAEDFCGVKTEKEMTKEVEGLVKNLLTTTGDGSP